MYGLDLSSNNGLRAVANGGRIFTPIYVGAGAFSPEIASQDDYRAPTTAGYGLIKYKFPYVVAYENGGLARNGYYNIPVVGEGHHLEIFHISERDYFQKIYIFSTFDGEIGSLGDYGLIIYDKNGKCAYHSNLKTMKVLGHITKNNPDPVWYFGNRHLNKRYAFIQVGSDYTSKAYSFPGGSYVEQYMSQVYQEGNTVKVKKRALVMDRTGAGAITHPDFGDENSDVLWTIIDVTDL